MGAMARVGIGVRKLVTTTVGIGVGIGVGKLVATRLGSGVGTLVAWVGIGVGVEGTTIVGISQE
jgi:hypothetical protein